jgi:hypothetical protein
MDKLNHLGWVVHKSYEIGGYVFGIRTNSEDCGDWLAHVLDAYEAEDESEPYYSLWIPEEAEAVGSKFYVLYRESDELVRTLDPTVMAQRLLAELASFALRRRTEGIFLNACVVERGGMRALIPSSMIPFMRQAGRRVERELSLPLDPTVGVAPDGRLFAAPDVLGLPADSAEDLAWRIGADTVPEHRDLVPASVDAICVFHYDPSSGPIVPLTRALTVHALARQAHNLHASRGAHLGALAELVASARCYLLQNAKPREAFELLTEVLDGDGRLLPAATS